MNSANSKYPYEIRLQAMEWRVRLDAGDVDEFERAELEAWLAADIRHEHAFDRASTAWAAYSTLGHEHVDEAHFKESLIDRLRFAVTGFMHSFAMSRERTSGVVAALTVLIVVGVFMSQGSLLGRFAQTEVAPIVATYKTKIGELRTFTLSDQSEITLGPGTHIEVALSAQRREITLLQGAAVFDVTKDTSRPFIVKADAFTARVLGTVFDVRNNGGVVRLSVSEGTVEAVHPFVIFNRLIPLYARRNVNAGEQLFANREDGLADIRPLKFDQFASWRDDRLRYLSAPLSELVADANRYSSVPIIFDNGIDDGIDKAAGDLETLKVTFAFDGHNVQGMLAALPSILPVIIDKDDKSTIVIRATPSSD